MDTPGMTIITTHKHIYKVNSSSDEDIPSIDTSAAPTAEHI
jgi:hypothetical protein